MDIKRSNRIKKVAAIAALVLVVGSAGVAAEVGNVGRVYADDPAVSVGTNDSTVKEISSAEDFKQFIENDEYRTGILTTSITVDCTEDGYVLKEGKHLYGGGYTITISDKTVSKKNTEYGVEKL